MASAPLALSGPPLRRAALWDVLIGLVLPSLLLLLAIVPAGIWDPYELNVADLARRAAVHVLGAHGLELSGAENRIPTTSDVGRGELPVLAIALGFRVFGLSAWAGRLPMALSAIAALVVLWLWLGRMAGRRAGTYATLLLSTTPLFFVHARTMLGDITTMASLIFSFAGLSVVTLDPATARRSDAAWAGLGVLGLVMGFYCRGGLVGVAVPALSVSLSWLVLAANEGRARARLSQGAVAVALLLTGLVAAYLGNKALDEATAERFQRWLGAQVIGGQKFPTFDAVIHYLGHTLFPWSALLPLCVGRLFSPPPGVTGEALAREQRLRLLVLCGAGLSYAAYSWMAPRTGYLPFGAVGLLAVMGALVLQDFERGAHPSRALAVASCLLAVLFYADFTRIPDKGLSAFGIANVNFPEAFRQTAERFIMLSAGVFALLLLLSLIDGHERYQAPEGRSFLRRFTAVDDVAEILRQLNAVWQGNLAFCAVMIEAMLLGLGALLFLSLRFDVAGAFRDSMSERLRTLLLNVWWALPLGLLALLFVTLSVRHLFRLLLGRTGISRAWVTLAAGVLSGLVLSLGYYPALAQQLSPKEVFDAYARLHASGEPLGLLGVAGRSSSYYAKGEVRPFSDADEAFAWLMEGPERRWLAMRSEELPKLNSLYRGHAHEGGQASPDHNLPVLDGHSGQILLASSELAPGQKNDNPLARIVHFEAPSPAHGLDIDPNDGSSGLTPEQRNDDPHAPIVRFEASSPAHRLEVNLNDELEALGWEVRETLDSPPVRAVVPGKSYVLTFYYRVLSTPSGRWKSFIHIDGFNRRFNGDHEVAEGKYPMNLWQPGDIITDHFALKLEPNFTAGTYNLYFGFFSGDRRMQVKSGKHTDNRIDGGAFLVQ